MNQVTLNDLTPLEVRYFGNDGKIVFFSICEFEDKLFGEDSWNNPEYSYKKLQNAVINFHPDVYYYSAPREDFDYGTAADETKKSNKHYCIVEDLS